MQVYYIDRDDEERGVGAVVAHRDGFAHYGVWSDLEGMKIPINRPEGDRSVLVTGLHAEEPVFVFRGQDALALGAISLWREMAWQGLTTERLAQVDGDVTAFIEWGRANPGYLKLPD